MSNVDPPTKSKQEASSIRTKNFKPLEDEVIIREVENRKHILFAAFTSRITKSSKDLQWKEIAAAVVVFSEKYGLVFKVNKFKKLKRNKKDAATRNNLFLNLL